MVQLTIGTNTTRKQVIVEHTAKLSDILAQENINQSGTALNLNGGLIPPSNVDKTLAELGVADNSSAMLITVVKAESAQ